MLLKDRTESEELLVLRYLDARMELTEKEKYRHLNLEKGFEGELQFDKLAENLQEERYVVNDLLLEVNNSYFQIDKFIISQGVIHLLDIKNYEGECYIKSGNLYTVANHREYKNPVDQLKRAALLLRQLLHNLKLNYLVEPFVIFINPEFTLYQAPLDDPIILPTQVNGFLRDLNNTPSKLNDGHKKLAQILISLHKTKNPFTVFPTYTYDHLHKGIYCKTCKSFLLSIKNYDFVCRKCGRHEKIEDAVIRNVKEFALLFPDRKVTTKCIYEWCNVDLSKRTFCRILKKNYTAFGNTCDTYYK